ncbi:succinylglutamate desuccinylase/aspartoacylase family protein [Halorubrum vacuolatum]|uniref:Succinylglutamate desuccinylase/Aspartoacylase catalytic domain-containing protein n=1 Tax=Halorubrum vacuolatum TaxID=63740 RepID=A0A238VAC4_HALVU|nr:succinylglutamate desuccinylase/aspartoacylase family protein [Halorubrum vacuolatum]SNR31360.1 hypothetical protein SAMN06264855_102171 [Halorubrum vacuolatum]
MQLGTATAEPGTFARGWFEVADLPTGTPERLPVLIANGSEPGPSLWLTGGVHGDEATGIAAVLDAMAAFEASLSALSGAVVAVPVVSPAGLRRSVRHTYYDDADPNRHFPDADASASRPPKLQERIDRRLYEAIVDGPTAADALIDCHTAGVASEPFAIRDRVLYGDRRTEAEANALADELETIVDAFGFPIVTEYPAAEYVEENLHRSLAGAVLNDAGVPAFTAELGAHSVVDDELVAAAVDGIHRIALDMGLLTGDELEHEAGVTAPSVSFPVRRYRGPTAEVAGLVRHHVGPGEVFEDGDVLAQVVSATGEPRATIRVEHDGYMLGRTDGLAVYEGDPIASLAVRDDGDLVVPRDVTE